MACAPNSPCIFVFPKEREYPLIILQPDYPEIRMRTEIKSFKDRLGFNLEYIDGDN